MKNKLFIIVMCCMIGSSTLAQDWVNFTRVNPEAPIIDLIQSSNQIVELSVEVCGMFVNEHIEQNETFQRIDINAWKMTEAGEPELPFIRQLIAIPECDDIVLNLGITGQLSFNDYNIFPAPTYQEMQGPNGGTYVGEVFTIDSALYAQNQFFPGVNAIIASTGYLRDQKYAEVHIFPIQFNPVSQQINVFTHCNVQLTFTNPVSDVNVNTGIFNNVATHTLLNYVSSGITASVNANVKGNGNIQWITLTDPSQADNIVADYLIICSDPFFEPNNPDSEVLRIASHRATYNGFDVAILSTGNLLSDELGLFYEGQIQGDDTYKKEQRIRTAIRRIYEGANAQNTYDGKLGYVLLIGDSEHPGNLGMPTSYDQNPGSLFGLPPGRPYPSDYYYSCLTSEYGIYDHFGDLYVGRFCISDNTQLHNIVSKTIYYESEATFENWRNEIGVLIHGDRLPAYTAAYFSFMSSIAGPNFSVNSIDDALPDAIQNTYNTINEGVSLFFYYGHGMPTCWHLDEGILSMGGMQNNLTNNNKAPIAHDFACYTGAFDRDWPCFGERLTTYSDTKGFTGHFGAGLPWISSHGFIANPPIQFQELLPYCIFNNLSHITGEYILETKIATPRQNSFAFNFFGDPALNVMAQGYEITQSRTLPVNTIISTEITVRNGVTIWTPPYGQLRFEGKGKLIIEEGASLIINSGTEVLGNIDNSIHVHGTILTGNQNITFDRVGETGYFDGLYLYIDDTETTFNNISFNNTRLSQYGAGLTLNNCTFNDCDIIYSTGNSTISGCTLAGTSLLLDNLLRDPDTEVEVLGNTFANTFMYPAIWVWAYDNFKIENNVIQNSEVGIKLSYSGNGATNNTIKDNHIYNCDSSGIESYASYAVIENNNIHDNLVGIKLMNNSNVAIRGNRNAQNYSETQLIRFNTSYELYASLGSFPWQLRYNVIWDEYDPNLAYNWLIYYDIPYGYRHDMLDIRYNCLGENFNPLSNLYPHTYYYYQPQWCPPGGELKSGDPIEDLYMGALDQMENGNYVEARNQFQQLIELYPSSSFAISAMKELFRIEKFALNDFAGLKQYFRTNDSIIADTMIMHLGDKLANKCEVELENWMVAINWYEDMITNPLSFQDSIFAIIDLGYVYMLMDNQEKSSYAGRLKEFIPETKEIYFEHKNYLLSLLPGERHKEKFPEVSYKSDQGRLLQNVPNPFSETTQIGYTLEHEALVSIIITDLTGKVVKQYNEGHQSKGAHKIDVIKKDLAPGTYFYILHINGKPTDTRKMVVM